MMKRSLILSSVLLSFGLATSVDLQQAIAAELNDKVDKTHDEADEKLIYKIDQHDYELYTDVLPVRTDCYIHRDVKSSLLLNDYIANQAIEQGLTKFGSAISDNIAKQYKSEIIPKFKEVISNTTKDFSTNDWLTLKWSTQPSRGLGEKIIHLYNGDSGRDILRFHVRRDQRPKQGYYFNFHYHTMVDNYESHNELGIVYWGKDMPPKWSTDIYDV
ncbi:YpjP family protein [Halalkalibacter sp. APA_J-10(15)]|uniref:YpjP family protein n=1 Tax=Halalkalibacter sp. APA_J-10(15) TaxID=2933805 RepID=UPI001FF5EE31|nr:YpjP family protein [Halalkalibacter sp. APA_J-10(15)]MCK0472052.1 YpjP family protein [Halalkalibacter sp. APA_J-10(15)]